MATDQTTYPSQPCLTARAHFIRSGRGRQGYLASPLAMFALNQSRCSGTGHELHFDEELGKPA